MDYQVIEVNGRNADKEGLFCIKNPKYPGFQLKLDWLSQRIKEGLKLKLLKVDGATAGFIEYVPGKFAWRPVKANDYLFVHCMWVFPTKNLGKGYGSLLVRHCLEDAKNQKLSGVAVLVSEGTWMAGKSVYQKNGFELVDSKGRFDLLVYKFSEAKDPEIIDWEKQLDLYKGLNLMYANQCPLFIKSVEEMRQTAKKHGLELKVKVLESAGQAQQAPSGFGVYSLVYNGRLLADHYISNTRFENILNKEIR
ncbi:MAG: GNAT family N-acetyltransferase [Bacteroidales bacterium]|nr:GNAT family N-acetyltransferase [Bacteroidales bacterium]